MVWSARLKCEKCKQTCPAGPLVIRTLGTKTVTRAYDPGAYVWRGSVGITKLRHPDCVPLTKRMLPQLKEALGWSRSGQNLAPSVRQSLQDWAERVTPGEAEEERKVKRKAARDPGINPDATNMSRGNFKPKGPPASWRKLGLEELHKFVEKPVSSA